MIDAQMAINKLDSIYGTGRGLDIYTKIMPGIISDFNRMLDKASPGQEVCEQYGTEDKRAVLSVKGKKSASGQAEITMDVMRI